MDSLRAHQLLHDFFLDITLVLGVQHFESSDQMLRGVGLEFLLLDHAEHVLFKLLEFDVVAWLVTLEDGDNMLRNLSFRGKLQQVSHDR